MTVAEHFSILKKVSHMAVSQSPDGQNWCMSCVPKPGRTKLMHEQCPCAQTDKTDAWWMSLSPDGQNKHDQCSQIQTDKIGSHCSRQTKWDVSGEVKTLTRRILRVSPVLNTPSESPTTMRPDEGRFWYSHKIWGQGKYLEAHLSEQAKLTTIFLINQVNMTPPLRSCLTSN